MTEWIKCSDRMPDIDVYVLVYVPSGATKSYLPDNRREDLNYNHDNLYVDVMKRLAPDEQFRTEHGSETTWYGDDDALLCGNDAVTHWMPLPALPESGEGCNEAT